MKVIFLAVLLAVMQAPPPVPRKAADSPARGGHSVKENPDGHQSPAPPQSPGTNSAAASKEKQNSSEAPTDANAKETVIIREPAPVPITRKDSWDRAYVIFTGALFVVAAIGVCLAYKSLRAIESQAGIMQGQLTAMGQQITEMQNAGLQTDELIKSMKDTAVRELRAYVCLTKAQIAFKDMKLPVMQIYMKNCGKTPAYEVRWWHGTRVWKYPLDVPLPEPSPDFRMATAILAPGGEPHLMIAKPREPIEDSLVQLVLHGDPRATLYQYGRVTYKDAFGIARYTNYRLIHGGAEGVHLLDKNGVPVALLKPDRLEPVLKAN